MHHNRMFPILSLHLPTTTTSLNDRPPSSKMPCTVSRPSGRPVRCARQFAPWTASRARSTTYSPAPADPRPHRFSPRRRRWSARTAHWPPSPIRGRRIRCSASASCRPPAAARRRRRRAPPGRSSRCQRRRHRRRAPRGPIRVCPCTDDLDGTQRISSVYFVQTHHGSLKRPADLPLSAAWETLRNRLETNVVVVFWAPARKNDWLALMTSGWALRNKRIALPITILDAAAAALRCCCWCWCWTTGVWSKMPQR